MEAFQKFSDASGLCASAQKSSLYLGGVSSEEKASIKEERRFEDGVLPFRYLGVPLSSKKLIISQCMPLVEKIVAKIKCWSAKFLSYAGRLQMVKSVLFGVRTYWAQVFILPKKIVKMVEAACRSFLWAGVSASRKAMVAWDQVCKPLSAGGLNILRLEIWNQTAIIKQLWAVSTKKDCLWIKWVHNYYIKKDFLEQCQIPKTASWVVRKIIESRDAIMQIGSTQSSLQESLKQCVQAGKFSIKRTYSQMLPQFPKVERKPLTMHASIHPRCKFILWLAVQRRLATVERLQKIGIQVPSDCGFCKATAETFEHLFFDCAVTKTLWNRLLQWDGVSRPTSSWTQDLTWICAMARCKIAKGIVLSCLFALAVTLIWRERNMIRFQQHKLEID